MPSLSPAGLAYARPTGGAARLAFGAISDYTIDNATQRLTVPDTACPDEVADGKR